MNTVAAPLDWVQSLAALRLPPKSDDHLQQLMDRNTEGLLSDAERADLGSLVELSKELALVRGQALQLLGQKPQ